MYNPWKPIWLLSILAASAGSCSKSTSVTVGGSTTGGSSSGGTTSGGSTSLKCPVASTGSSMRAKLPRRQAIQLDSGLKYQILSPPTGSRKPGETDIVRVHYTGYTSDGKAFDSTLTTNTPLEMPLSHATAGWQEALQSMAVGEERRVWMPSSLAYEGTPPAGAPTGTLVFDILLVAVHDPAPQG